MATKLAKIAADFRTSLATAIAVGGNSATLQSIVDDDGNNLANGTYFFTIDGDNSKKEHIVCTLTGTALTAISSISRQGVQSAGVVRAHRIGASVVITNFAHIKYINDLLDGTTNLNASTPLQYDGAATINQANQLATKAYADALAIAGAPNASETVKGIIELATNAEMGTHTSSGATGARLVPPNDQLVATSAGAADANKIPTLNGSGVLADSFLDAARTWGTVQSFTADNCQITTDANSNNDALRKSYLDGRLTESDAFFAATDITGAEAESLSSGGVISTLHFHKRTFGATTGNGAGSQNIAHGMGATPKYIRITAILNGGGNQQNSEGVGDGTNAASVWVGTNGGGAITVGNDGTNIIRILSTGVSVNATAALNGTNIVLTWSNNGNGGIQILWEAFM